MTDDAAHLTGHPPTTNDLLAAERGAGEGGPAPAAPGAPAGRLPPLREAASVLVGRRVRLRRSEPRDQPAFERLFGDPTVTRWWPAPDPAAEARDHISPDDADVAVWAIELLAPDTVASGGPETGGVIGLIQAVEEPEPDYRHVGIDIAIAGEAQGQGIGPDAITTLLRWLFEARAHHRATIDPAADNEDAIRAYERVGFRRVGVMRRYERGHDGLLLDMLAEELERADEARPDRS